jgi:hypothetical protein
MRRVRLACDIAQNPAGCEMEEKESVPKRVKPEVNVLYKVLVKGRAQVVRLHL